MMRDNVRAVDPSVEERKSAQGLHGSFDKERHKAQANAVLFPKAILKFLAKRNDSRHVHFIECGQSGGGLLRRHESIGDALSDGAHSLSCFPRGAGSDRTCRLGSRPSDRTVDVRFSWFTLN